MATLLTGIVNLPSIGAVVGDLEWPLKSHFNVFWTNLYKYRADNINRAIHKFKYFS